MNNIIIDGTEIGGDDTYVIAEIGSNHNQSISLAYESIDAALESGANAVKFQSIALDQLYYEPSVKTKALHQKIDMDDFILRLKKKKKKIGVYQIDHDQWQDLGSWESYNNFIKKY